MAEPRPHKGRRVLRTAFISLAAILALFVIALVVLVATFNANSYKPRIVAAVKSATGRDLTLNGPIGLRFALHPTIELSDVGLSNPPGFSRPEMAKLQALDLQLDLWPLLARRIEVTRLVLVHPDVLLERNARGEPNWLFARAAAPSPAPTAQAPPVAGNRAEELFVKEFRVENGTIGYRDDRTGHSVILAVRRLAADADSPTSPLRISGDASVDGVGLALAAQTGPLARLQGAAGPPWPMTATLAAAGAKLAVNGTVAEPAVGKGYDLKLDAAVPDLAPFRAWFPGAKLPEIHDAAFSAHVADSGGPLPAISALTLRTGPADLSAFVPTLSLTKLDIAAPALDQPLHAAAEGAYGGVPLALSATAGAPIALLPGGHSTGHSPGRWPIDVALTAGGSSFALKGGIADPGRLAGVDLALTAQVPDLAALSPLARRPLPPLRGMSLTGKLSDAGGLAHGFELKDLTLATQDGTIRGSAAATMAGRPSFRADLVSDRLDVDGFRAALARAQAGPPPAPPTTPAPASPPVPKSAPSSRLIPNTPIPFAQLRAADADVRLTVVTLKAGGQDLRNVAAHLVVQEGKLALPLTATVPGGPVALTTTADATQPTPPVTLALRAPALPLPTLLAILGAPAIATGNLDLSADLHGAGDTPHAIAAGLDGTLSLTMGAGAIETRTLEQALGPVIARANPLALAPGGGTSQIRCLALRSAIRNGVAALAPLVLDSTLLSVDGTGTVQLGQETIALNLFAHGQAGRISLAVPVSVSGSLRKPTVKLTESGAAAAGLRTALGLLNGGANPPPAQSGPSCASALAAARGQAPPTATAAPKPQTRKAPAPADLLRQFLR
jgi:AsmA protein